jgi:membrane-associated phospholipid phosphatase
MRKIGIGLLAAFSLWTLLVGVGALRGADAAVMALTKQAPGAGLDLVAGVLNYAVAAEVSVAISLLAAGWLSWRGVPAPAVAAPLAWLLVLPIELGLKFTLDQAPPGADLYRETLHYGLWTLKTMQSYPSGHAGRAVFFAVFFGLLAGRLLGRAPILWCLLGVLAVASAWCRVYQGMHWPSDVLGGGFLGGAAACFAYGYLAPWLNEERPRTVLVRGLLGRRERAG